MTDNMKFTEIKTPIDIPCLKDIKTREKYIFNEMKIGDHTFFEGQVTGGKAYMAAQAHGRYKNKKFRGKTVDGGLCIWRTK